MKFFIIISALAAICSPPIVSAQKVCPDVTTVENFDIKQYASKKWYIHQQAVTQYSPIEQNFCTSAEYSLKSKSTFWGYTVGVNNFAEDKDGNAAGGPLCAYQDRRTASKLNVAPCFLPKGFAGPYWVVDYNETEGYALISGGQPTIPSTTGGCRTGDGINSSGLWIFTRNPVRDETLIQKVRSIAEGKGFDLTVLNDVVQVGCYDDPVVVEPTCKDQEGTFKVWFGSQKSCSWVRAAKSGRCLVYADRCPATCGKC